MADAADLFAQELTVAKPAFAAWVDALPPADRKLFYVNAANRDLSTLGMVRVAKALGAKVNKDSVEVWRRANGLHR